MVEIGGGEMAVPMGRPAPRAVVEAFGRDRDIVAVEHAVHEAGGDIGGGEPRGAAGDAVEQPRRRPPPAPRRRGGAGNNRRAWRCCRPVEISEPLEGCRCGYDRGPAGPARPSRSARIVVASRPRRSRSAKSSSRSRRRALRASRSPAPAQPALQGQPAVAEAAIGGLARSLGAEVEQAPTALASPSRSCANRKPRPSPMSGLAHAELVAVIPRASGWARLSGSGAKRPKWPIHSSSLSPSSPTARPPGRCGTAGGPAGSRPP